MKATHNKASEPDKVEWNFPCLGKLKSGIDIVLFTSTNEGTVIVGSIYNLGDFSERWTIENFQPLPSTESVTLQND
jgi:hypothetical protein